MDAPGAVADDFREERRIELVRALPPKKGASLREESSSEDTAEEAVEEKGRREVSGRGVGTEGENARHPSRRLVHRKGNNGGRWVLQPREIVDNENRRRHLVVSRSLTRVGLFFSLDVKRAGEFVRVRFVKEKKVL